MQKTIHWENLSAMQATLRELKSVAEADRNALLVFLIEMAYVEASDQLRALHAADAAKPGTRVRFAQDRPERRLSS